MADDESSLADRCVKSLITSVNHIGQVRHVNDVNGFNQQPVRHRLLLGAENGSTRRSAWKPPFVQLSSPANDAD